MQRVDGYIYLSGVPVQDIGLLDYKFPFAGINFDYAGICAGRERAYAVGIRRGCQGAVPFFLFWRCNACGVSKNLEVEKSPRERSITGAAGFDTISTVFGNITF